MHWNQVCIHTSEHACDIVSNVLLDAGANGVEVDGGSSPTVKNDEYLTSLTGNDPIVVKAYYGDKDFDSTLQYIKGHVDSIKYTSDIEFGNLTITVNIIKDTDWNENFKKHFTSFRAAGNIVIKPTWEAYDNEPDDIVIEMDPGMAFGSGVHETTKMCLQLVQEYMPSDASVLDVGCGSGILGIACAKLGAKDVLALDYDNVSVKVTKDNATANGVTNLNARQSDLLQNADNKKYDIVLANIIADVVIRLNEDVGQFIKREGVYIMSGIIEDRLDDVLRSLQENNFTVLNTMNMGDWRALAVRSDHA